MDFGDAWGAYRLRFSNVPAADGRASYRSTRSSRMCQAPSSHTPPT
jgi:hypothetical protein